MTPSKHCVTCGARSSPGANAPRPRRLASVIGALTLVLGCAICASAAPAQSSPVISGKWQLSCTSRKGRTRQIALDIEQQGPTLSGSFKGGRRSGQLHGSVQGNRVSFDLVGAHRSATFTGTRDGNTLDVHTAKGISCTATRQ